MGTRPLGGTRPCEATPPDSSGSRAESPAAPRAAGRSRGRGGRGDSGPAGRLRDAPQRARRFGRPRRRLRRSPPSAALSFQHLTPSPRSQPPKGTTAASSDGGPWGTLLSPPRPPRAPVPARLQLPSACPGGVQSSGARDTSSPTEVGVPPPPGPGESTCAVPGKHEGVPAPPGGSAGPGAWPCPLTRLRGAPGAGPAAASGPVGSEVPAEPLIQAARPRPSPSTPPPDAAPIMGIDHSPALTG